MKPNLEPEQDRALDKALKQWVVDDPLPARFQEQVWQRITRNEARPDPTFRASLLRLMEFALPRPRFALSYVAALLLLGMLAGSWAGRRESSRMNTALGSRYVQSVDPFHPTAPDL
jgi:hypothetical protein